MDNAALPSVVVSDCGRKATIAVDPKVYRLTAIRKAAYRLSAEAAFFLATQDNGQVIVTVEPTCGANMQSLVERFRRELLDQELREEIATETAAVRNLLLAQAFSAASLTDPSVDSGNYESPPKDSSDTASM